jgi:hypothetical protein
MPSALAVCAASINGSNKQDTALLKGTAFLIRNI